MTARMYSTWILGTALGFAGCGGDDEHPDDGQLCGAGTHDVDGVCVPDGSGVACGPGTHLVGDACVPDSVVPPTPPLEPLDYSSPFAQLQRLQGEEDHMHMYEVKYRESDSMLFYCSYTFGMIDASDPQEMEYVFQGLRHETPSGSPRDPGCLHLAWDDADPDVIYTTHRKNIDFATFLSGWDRQSQPDPDDPDETIYDPVQLPALQEPDVSYEGLDVENGLIYVAIHEDGMAIYEPRPGPDGFARLGTASGLDNAWDVAVRGTTAFVIDEVAGLVTFDVTDPASPVELGRVSTGGQPRDILLEGDTAYLAAGSAGLVVVDVSDVAAPVVLGAADTPGTAETVAFANDRAYLGAWNDTRAFDVSDPASPSIIGAIRNTVAQEYEDDGGLRPDPTARTFAVAAHDDNLFVGNWWVPYSYQVYANRPAPFLVLPEDAGKVTFGPVPVGENRTAQIDVRNDGTAPLTLFDNWTDNDAFTVEPRQVRIAAGESATLTVTYTATVATQEVGFLEIWSDDPQQPVRKAFLVGNQPGLGVGVPLPETTGILVADGSEWSSTSTAGSVLLLAYFATF